MIGCYVFGSKSGALLASIAFVFVLILQMPVWANTDWDLSDPPKPYDEAQIMEYSNFWYSYPFESLYGYGYEKDLTDIYELLDAIERREPALANPMKNIPNLLGRTTRSVGRDYMDLAKSDYRKYCTNFLGAAILLQLMSYDGIAKVICWSAELRHLFYTAWANYSAVSMWILLAKENYEMVERKDDNFPAILLPQSDGILKNLLSILYMEDIIGVNAYVEMNPHRDFPYIYWKIEEERLKERIG